MRSAAKKTNDVEVNARVVGAGKIEALHGV
jgi:hypothetical protein